MAADDIFCGECGFVARTVLAPAAATGGNDTIAITADPELLLRSRSRGRGRSRRASPSPRSPSPSRSRRGTSNRSRPRSRRPDLARSLGERFVLQFSTGESVTVRGTGLIGRNPALGAGEYVDDLIAIVDEGKSVSKTHLEFGQEDGVVLGERPVLDERDRHPASRAPSRGAASPSTAT